MEEHYCKVCGKDTEMTIITDWLRFAFSHEEFCWIYTCVSCGNDVVTKEKGDLS